MGKSRGKKYQYISEESVKKFLEDNNVSLEQLGGEAEQEKFISDLSKALISLRKSSNATREECLRKVALLTKKIDWPEGAINLLGDTFIPRKVLGQKEKSEIEELKTEVFDTSERVEEAVDEAKKIDDEIEKTKKELEKKKTEIEELEAKLKELEESKKVKTEPQTPHEIVPIEPAEIIEPEVVEAEIVDSKSVDIPKDTHTSEIIEVDVREVKDSEEETIRDMIKGVWDTHKEKQNEIKNLETKKEKTIYEGVKSICKSSTDLLRFELINGELGHDILTAGAIGLGTAVAVAGYTAGRATLKLAKGVVKLGAKGVEKLAGLGFKAAKGTAKLAKQKADSIRAKRQEKITNQYESAIDSFKEADSITKKVLNFSCERLYKSIVDIYDLDEEKAEILKDVRDDELRGESEEELNIENVNILRDAKDKLRHLRVERVYYDFNKNFRLKDREIKSFLYDVGIDQNGELVIGPDSPVTLEQIEEAGIDEHLKAALSMPRVSDLSNEEVMLIASNIGVRDGKIEYPLLDDNETTESLEVSENAIKFIQALKGSEFYYNGLEKDVRALNFDYDNFTINQEILEEAYSRDLIGAARELRDQVELIRSEFFEIEFDKEQGKKQDEEEIDKVTPMTRRQKELKRLAEEKVQTLSDVGIAEVVQDENKKTVRILDEARGALSQDLQGDLEYTVDKKSHRIYRETEQEEEQTQE